MCAFAGVFEGGCGKTDCLDVVFRWWKRGGMRGGCGVLAPCFWTLKNAPTF
jgi:hypothetical protein